MKEEFKDGFSIQQLGDIFCLYHEGTLLTSDRDYFKLKNRLKDFSWVAAEKIVYVETEAFFFDPVSNMESCNVTADYPKTAYVVIEHGGLRRIEKKLNVFPATNENKHILRKLNYLNGKVKETRNKALSISEGIKTMADTPSDIPAEGK